MFISMWTPVRFMESVMFHVTKLLLVLKYIGKYHKIE